MADEPVQAETTERVNELPESLSAAPEAQEKPKRATRPKVGRSSGTRKKKADDKETMSAKKESKPRKKQTSAAASDKKTDEVQPEVTAKETVTMSALEVDKQPELLQDSTPQILTSKTLSEKIHEQEVADMELPADWVPEHHSRPQSFKSILFAVILFVLIPLGFMSLFSASHKAKLATPAPGAMTATKAPVVQPPVVEMGSEPTAAPRATGISHIDDKPAEVSALPPAVPPAPAEASTPMNSENPAAPAAEVPASQAKAIPPIPPAASAPAITGTAATAAPVQPVTSTNLAGSAEPAAAQAVKAPAAAENKAVSSQELLSILDKN